MEPHKCPGLIFIVTAAWRVPRAIAFTMLAAVALPHLSLVRIRVQSLLVSAWLTKDSDDELQLLLVASLYLVHKRKKRRRKKCLGSANLKKKRRQHGEYHQILQEMRFSDPESHFKYLRTGFSLEKIMSGGSLYMSHPRAPP